MSAAAKHGVWSSWSLSILMHALLVALVAGFWFWRSPPPPPEHRLAIEASVVLETPAAAVSAPAPLVDPVTVPVAQLPLELVPEPAALPAVDPVVLAAEKKQQDAELARQTVAARAAEAARVAEQRRVAEARRAAERKAARDKDERDKKEREKVERAKTERERIERERKQHEQAGLEQARLQRESELNAQIAAEERAAALRASGQMQQYLDQIKARIESTWKRPPNAAAGVQCLVRVTQVPGGVVTGVQVTRCNGDESVRQSVEDAVYRASPLPQPSDPALFDRNLAITFRPEK